MGQYKSPVPSVPKGRRIFSASAYAQAKCRLPQLIAHHGQYDRAISGKIEDAQGRRGLDSLASSGPGEEKGCGRGTSGPKELAIGRSSRKNREPADVGAAKAVLSNALRQEDQAVARREGRMRTRNVRP